LGFVLPDNNTEKEMDPDRQLLEGSNAGAGVWLAALWQDVRFGIRMMTKNLAFSIVVIITLALGIGGYYL
jgi:hypothetical protein